MNKPTASTHPLHFRDANGHVDPRYAADLLARSRATAGPRDPRAFSEADLGGDSIAEGLAEEFVRTATSGEEDASDLADADTPEELGGPFVASTSEQELAYDTDASNPEDATREPFPRPGPLQ